MAALILQEKNNEKKQLFSFKFFKLHLTVKTI